MQNVNLVKICERDVWKRKKENMIMNVIDEHKNIFNFFLASFLSFLSFIFNKTSYLQ